MSDFRVPYVNTFYVTLRQAIMYTFTHPQAIKSCDANFEVLEKALTEEPLLRVNITIDAIFVNNSLAKINKFGVDFLYGFFNERSLMGFLITPGIDKKEYMLFFKLLMEIKGADIPTIGRAFDSYGITHIQLQFKAPGGQSGIIGSNMSGGSNIMMSGGGMQGNMQGGGYGMNPGMQGGGYGSGDGTGQGAGTGTGQGQGVGGGQGTGTGNGTGQGDAQGGYGINSMMANAAQMQAQQAGYNPQQRKGTKLFAEISEEDILSLLSDEVGAEYIEDKYDLFPWKELNNLERAIRLGKMSVLPREYVKNLNLVEIYKSVPVEKIGEVLDNMAWLISYNIGDNRDYVRVAILANLKKLITVVRVNDLVTMMPAMKYIFDYIGERDETKEFVDNLADIVLGYLDRLIADEHYAEITMIARRLFTTPALNESIPKKDIYEVIRSILEALRKNMKTDDKEVIKGTLVTLSELSVMPILQLLMDENDREMRRELMSILVTIGEPAIPYLKRMLIDKRWFVVRNGVKILGEVKTNFDLEILWQPLTHSDERVRSETITSLYNIGGIGTAKMLKRYLLVETNFELAVKAVKGIATIADITIMNELVMYVQQMASTMAYAPVVQAVIDEIITFMTNGNQMTEQLLSLLNLKTSFALFSTDSVTEMKNYLLQKLKSRDMKLFSEIAVRIENSENKDLKKLIRK